MRRDETTILHLHSETRIPSADGFYDHLRAMGYAPEVVGFWQSPDDGAQFALAFPGVGDREGEFALVVATGGELQVHRLKDAAALEQRLAELPSLAAAMQRERAAIRRGMARDGETVLAFARPMNRAERRRRARG